MFEKIVGKDEHSSSCNLRVPKSNALLDRFCSNSMPKFRHSEGTCPLESFSGPIKVQLGLMKLSKN